jgi:fimbrial chaperone protein
VLATPPIFTIAAGGIQIVRVGLRRQPDSRRELTYRLFLQEVPTAAAKEGQIRLILRFGIPVFVASADTASRPLLEWRAVISPQKALRIEAINHGNAHVQVSGFTLAAADGSSHLAKHQGMDYLLPEQGRHWVLAVDQAWSPGTRLKIVAQTDAGEIDAEVELVEH